MNKSLKALQRKLESMEIEHLRQHAKDLYERLERTEADLDAANESAYFWQSHANELQQSLQDDEHATHRCVGINKAGELMVVKMSESAPS